MSRHRVPWVKLSKHAKDRIEERMLPLCVDGENPRQLVIDAVRDAHINRRFSRKVPSWARKSFGDAKIGKGGNHRIVTLKIESGETFAVLVGLRKMPKNYIVITVMAKEYRRETGGKAYQAMSSM